MGRLQGGGKCWGQITERREIDSNLIIGSQLLGSPPNCTGIDLSPLTAYHDGFED